MILRAGVKGDSVIVLQQELGKLGYYKAKPDGDFGPLTSQAVMLFQKNQGLVVDGEVGPLTQEALLGLAQNSISDDTSSEKASPTQNASDLRLKFLQDALVLIEQPDVGVVLESQGNNRSPAIDLMNQWMGVALGSSYCLTAQMYAMHKLCLRYGLTNPVPKMASTQEFVHDSRVLPHARPAGSLGMKSDLAIFQHTTSPSQGHAVVLREDQVSHPTFLTIEYNTNSSGSRDGDGCWQHLRSEEHMVGSSLKFQHFVDVCSWILSVNPNFHPPV